MQEKRKLRNAIVGDACVACGCCVAVCPKQAIRIDRGVRARVDEQSCVGCGKCVKACPAGVIDIWEVQP
ncbi:4Fe-4S dicluster domain-containing protein [Oscillibacter sp.]|uniref:4Fe-4S dicluster domain-containing protein n=1 Tax=Oscillibacter sp. TaxID=1945593 RepID=UPI0028ADF68C|nr:4Fe-4S dicluster domain-containing protein [Oscillibacter sp.]